jgi:imidazolonepropionase-like amidohydrolase
VVGASYITAGLISLAAAQLVSNSEPEGMALVVGKLLTLDESDKIFNPGLILMRGSKLEYVGELREVPEGYEVLKHEELWAWPGLVDLHSHIHGPGRDLNDMVKPLNPELRASPTFDPFEERIEVATAAGVTTLFGIPGSGTSISGFGLVYKTKRSEPSYDNMVVRDPGGMKVAQNFNPQRGAGDVGNTWCGLAFNLEHLNDRVSRLASDDEAELDWQLENLARVHRGELPVLIHCASAEGVAAVVRMWKVRYGTDCVVSHGSWDGWMAAGFAAKHGVPVNHGPRTANMLSTRREDRVVGGAAEYTAAGVPLFSLNTDAPVIPQEQLFLQGSMSARLGADAYHMLRAVTTHPAQSFQLADRVGSLESGKDADVVLSTGDPLDPRSRVEFVFIDGQLEYSRADDGQIF